MRDATSYKLALAILGRAGVELLSSEDKHLIKTFIDAFLTKRKVQKLAQ